MPIRITGLNSGLDTEAIISALVSSYNYKTEKYKKAQTKLSWKQDAWKTLNTKIYSLYNNVGTLRFSSAYNLKSTTVSDTTKATVTASSSAPNGTQKLNILQVAQAGYLTGAKLDDSTSTGTTLAELGYTGGDGEISVTMGDGTTKSITVSQGTTISSFITSLKSAGLNANYDDVNKRIFVSSKETGADNDFTLTGANVDGAVALSKMGLNVSSDATTATYESYAKYYYDGYDVTAGVATGNITDNVKDALADYVAAKEAYENAQAANGNLTASYGYASAYSAMMDTLSKIADTSDREKLQTLLGMTATERVNSVMDTDGNVYKKTAIDADGNPIYSYSDGTNTKYIMGVTTYTDENNKTYTLNSDKTYTDENGVVYKATKDKDADGNTIYESEDGTSRVSITSEVSYYEASANTETLTTYTDANKVVYTQKTSGSDLYEGSDGKQYKLISGNMTEVDENGDAVADGNVVAVTDDMKGETTKTTYAKGSALSDIERSADVLTSLRETYTDELTDDDVKSLTTNISTVNKYEAVADTVLADSDAYSRASIAAAIKDAYANGYTDADGNTKTGADGVNSLVNTYASIITANKATMATNEETMEQHSVLASIANMEDGAEKDQAIADFVAQVQTAQNIENAVDYNTDAKKIDGIDSKITLNGIEYTSSLNTYSINGLNITAQQVTGEGDENAISITTATDTQGIYDKIKDFLTQYNALINELTSLYNAESAKGYEPLSDEEKDAMSDTEIEKWEEKIKASLLRRDDSLESVMNAMTSAMSKGVKIGDKTYYLSSFGIKTLGYLNAPENQHNAYHIDGDEDDASTSGNTDKLMAAIASDPETVMTFMQELTTNLYNAVGDKMKATSLSSTYTVYNDKEMASEYSDYTDLIKKWEEKLADQEDYYYNKFSAMETALSKLNSQTSSLSNMLGG